MLSGLLLLVVVESMHVFGSSISKHPSRTELLRFLAQVAIDWCSNAAQCQLYRCVSANDLLRSPDHVANDCYKF